MIRCHVHVHHQVPSSYTFVIAEGRPMPRIGELLDSSYGLHRITDLSWGVDPTMTLEDWCSIVVIPE